MTTALINIDKSSASKDVKAIVSIQRFWRRKRQSDSYFAVNPNGNHSEEFKQFLNAQPVKKSLNQYRASLLLEAINQGDWHAIAQQAKEADIFPAVALALYAAEKISHQQIATLLFYAAIAKDYLNLKVYPILNSEGDFTKEAYQYLLPCVRITPNFPKLLTEEINDFKLSLSELPVSERFFFVFEEKTEHSNCILFKSLIRLGSIYFNEEHNCLLHLTFGAIDALGEARFGISEYVRPFATLGRQSMARIEEGVRRYLRYTLVYFPGITAYKDIHGAQNVTYFTATCHDFYHSLQMSRQSKGMLNIFYWMIDIIRDKAKLSWSKEIWEWVDSDFSSGFLKTELPSTILSEGFSKIFCKVLSRGHGNEISKGGYLIVLGENNEITIAGLLIFIDMLENPSDWAKLGILPEYFEGPFQYFYTKISKIHALLAQDELLIKLFKLALFFSLNEQFQFHIINEAVNAQQPALINIEKITKKSPFYSLDLHNRLCLTYNGFLINRENIARLRLIIQTSSHPFTNLSAATKTNNEHKINAEPENSNFEQVEKNNFLLCEDNEVQFLNFVKSWQGKLYSKGSTPTLFKKVGVTH